jgi:hypothetical protein
MHWKEGEPIWRRRRARVAAANGGEVPAYATAAGGASMEVEVKEKTSKRRITAPDDPNQQVSREEFDEMVADLGLEETGRRSATATVEDEDLEPVPEAAAEPETPPQAPPSSTADATPEDLVMKDEPRKGSRRPRNRRHGRR